MTLEVPNELFIDNRTSLIRLLKIETPPRTVVLLQGAVNAKPLYDTSVNHAFEQHPFFNWAFGVEEPGLFGIIDILTCHTYLFAPEYSDECDLCGKQTLALEEIKIKYAVDACFHVKHIKSVLTKLKPELLLTLCGKSFNVKMEERNAIFHGIEQFNVNNTALFAFMSVLRLRKMDREITLLCNIYLLVEKAFHLTIQQIRPGMYDYQAEAIFKAVCLFEGKCRQCACVIPSTTYCSPRRFKDGDMVVLNLRAKHRGYKIDITQSFPANGKFTQLQADIYNAVLESHKGVIGLIKSDVSWIDLSNTSSTLLLSNLKKCGLLVGDVEDMTKVQLAAVFRRRREVLTLLEKDLTLVALHRMGLCPNLVSNMVLAVESSCYFTAKKLSAALADPRKARFFVPAMVKQLMNNASYSVCLKSNVYILNDMCKYLTPLIDVQQLEKVYSWKGAYS